APPLMKSAEAAGRRIRIAATGDARVSSPARQHHLRMEFPPAPAAARRIRDSARPAAVRGADIRRNHNEFPGKSEDQRGQKRWRASSALAVTRPCVIPRRRIMLGEGVSQVNDDRSSKKSRQRKYI